MKKKLFVISMSILPIFVNAQGVSKEIDCSLGITGNVYQGDLTPSVLGSIKDLKLGISGMLRYPLVDKKVYVRGILNVSTLKGDDAQFDTPEWRQHRNYSFTTSLIDFSVMLEYYLFKDAKKFQPYFSVGIGFARINPIRDISRIDTNYFNASSSERIGLIKEQSLTQPKVLLTIPASIGFRYKINETSSLFLDACYKTCISDYLDGFSLSVKSQKYDCFSVYTLGYTRKLKFKEKKKNTESK
jgi:Domain of unknown function (DUF6089)